MGGDKLNDEESRIIFSDLHSEFSNFESQNLSARMLQGNADNMTMEEYQNIFWMQKRILDAVIDVEDQPKTALII